MRERKVVVEGLVGIDQSKGKERKKEIRVW